MSTDTFDCSHCHSTETVQLVPTLGAKLGWVVVVPSMVAFAVSLMVLLMVLHALVIQGKPIEMSHIAALALYVPVATISTVAGLIGWRMTLKRQWQCAQCRHTEAVG